MKPPPQEETPKALALEEARKLVGLLREHGTIQWIAFPAKIAVEFEAEQWKRIETIIGKRPNKKDVVRAIVLATVEPYRRYLKDDALNMAELLTDELTDNILRCFDP
jgi:hypothetical protein